ncbi:unnamed protein product [Ilex paraguariensis]|uniref:mRNA capping enzyme C-terminal domain-containing protein n=1 Tax=Ilex paraguariensis TaxID=185542 RepID=A0ABC8QQZ0_9AQUA
MDTYNLHPIPSDLDIVENYLKYRHSTPFVFDTLESYRSTDDSDPLSYSAKIIECSWDSEKEVWVCMRIRTDKGTPNDFNTYKKVMRSIKDNITEDILLNEINEIIRLPMYADRIRNDSKPHPHSNPARRR